VTKTCLQCGAILPSSVRACSFCESSVSSSADPTGIGESAPWRGELAERLAAYRTRRRKPLANEHQSKFAFEPAVAPATEREPAVALTDGCSAAEDFSFTIAIGRTVNKRDDDPRMVIDVSLPLESSEAGGAASSAAAHQPGLYPVASIDDRRIAAVADAVCLLFAYGAFLALFGSVGGQFTLNKISAAVCLATLGIVYLQYFALFTIFGGTTPGMMLRGLQVVNFSGEAPTPRQMLLRSAGYILSAGTFFLGFLWAMWDEDSLTWHDRVSHTYLTSAQTLAEVDVPQPSHSR